MIATVKENHKLKQELKKVKREYSSEIPKLNKIITELSLKNDDSELYKLKEEKMKERIERLQFAYKELYEKTTEIIKM
mgnify:CR=1 FL=1